jgi:hypothetical protein
VCVCACVCVCRQLCLALYHETNERLEVFANFHGFAKPHLPTELTAQIIDSNGVEIAGSMFEWHLFQVLDSSDRVVRTISQSFHSTAATLSIPPSVLLPGLTYVFAVSTNEQSELLTSLLQTDLELDLTSLSAAKLRETAASRQEMEKEAIRLVRIPVAQGPTVGHVMVSCIFFNIFSFTF